MNLCGFMHRLCNENKWDDDVLFRREVKGTGEKRRKKQLTLMVFNRQNFYHGN